ncbi:hypothetical protein OOK31_18095 [Streptomyces sp. NBC_00249]|uniref:hypothetical protein n=1 Tax=Streptomyces sp. NBC_00249 TaxID=2975690 RepID=UPI0022563EEA|nr:hypothetical protein [Streptomyces sp. NBC_00249]MCX5195782.1 hypothetical protein [Streptomyces sp. NBC_00249]
MSRNEQNNAGLGPSDPGDMWHALAALRGTRSEPVDRLVPFERADALLSLTRPDDIGFTARVELSGGETMSHVHDLITAVTRGITYELGGPAADSASRHRAAHDAGDGDLGAVGYGLVGLDGHGSLGHSLFPCSPVRRRCADIDLAGGALHTASAPIPR